jgi:hypothetical protein
VARLEAEEGTYVLFLEVGELGFRAEAFQSFLRVLKGLLQHEEPEGLLQDLIREAVAAVPGAEAGSILLREGRQFYLVAQEGFSPTLLGTHTSLEEELAWYGLGVDSWLKGRPRVLKGEEVRRLSSLSTVEARPAFFEHGRLREIQATLGLPIALEGEVLAVMNLDSFTSPEAFGPLSLELAQAFALEAALLLKALKERQALQEVARTDPLTGLLNRRALEEAFPHLLEEARTPGGTPHPHLLGPERPQGHQRPRRPRRRGPSLKTPGPGPSRPLQEAGPGLPPRRRRVREPAPGPKGRGRPRPDRQAPGKPALQRGRREPGGGGREPGGDPGRGGPPHVPKQAG